jgi:DeoR/GlpR family transcriptional regulator of sugar metabolism
MGLHKDDEVVAFIREQGEASTDDIAEKFGVDNKTARIALRRLQNEFRIKHVTTQAANGAITKWTTPKMQTRRSYTGAG